MKIRIFPESEYGRHVPDIAPTARCTGLGYPTGGGKTSFFERQTVRGREAGLVNTAITHRKKLTSANARRLQIADYQDSEGQIFGDIAITLPSIGRIAETRPGNTMLDEGEAVWESFFVGTMKAATSLKAWAKIREILERSVQIHFADAFMTDYSWKMLRLALGRDPNSEYEDEEFWNTDAVPQQRVRLAENRAQLIAVLCEAARRGERGYVSVDSVQGAKIVAKLIQKLNPEARIWLASSDTTPGMNITAEVAKANAGEYDWIVGTPSIGVGISIDIKDHFDRTYILANAGVVAATATAQAAGRLRNPKNPTVLVHIQQGGASLSTDLDTIRREVLAGGEASQRQISKTFGERFTPAITRRRADGTLEPTCDPTYFEAFCLTLQNIRLKTANNYTRALYDLFAGRIRDWSLTKEGEPGYDEEQMLLQVGKDAYKAAAAEVEAERIEHLALAAVRTIEDIDAIKEPKSPEEKVEMFRARMCEAYGVDPTDLDAVRRTASVDRRGAFRSKVQMFVNFLCLASGLDSAVVAQDARDSESSIITGNRNWYTKAKLLVEAVIAAGIDPTTGQGEVGPDGAKRLVRFYEQSVDRFAICGWTLAKDWRKRPIAMFRNLLSKMGLKLGKFRQQRIKGVENRIYPLSAESLSHMSEWSAAHFDRAVEGASLDDKYKERVLRSRGDIEGANELLLAMIPRVDALNLNTYPLRM